MKQIIYSILQYRHSLLREEKFNIEITFYFPEIDNKSYSTLRLKLRF